MKLVQSTAPVSYRLNGHTIANQIYSELDRLEYDLYNTPIVVSGVNYFGNYPLPVFEHCAIFDTVVVYIEYVLTSGTQPVISILRCYNKQDAVSNYIAFRCMELIETITKHGTNRTYDVLIEDGCIKVTNKRGTQ